MRRIGTCLRRFLAICAESWHDLPAVLDRAWPIRTVGSHQLCCTTHVAGSLLMRASRNVPRPPAIPRDVAGKRVHAPETSHPYAGTDERRTEDSSVQKRNQIRGAEPHETAAMVGGRVDENVDESAATRVGPRPEPPAATLAVTDAPRDLAVADLPMLPDADVEVLVRSSELEWYEGEQTATQQWSGRECVAAGLIPEPVAAALVEQSAAAGTSARSLTSERESRDLDGAGEVGEEDLERNQASVDLVSSARKRLTGASQIAAQSKKSRGTGSRAILLGLGVHLLITVACVYFAWVSPLKQFIGQQQRRHEQDSQQHAQALADLEDQRLRARQAFEAELTQLRSQLDAARTEAQAAAVEGASHAAKARRAAKSSASSAGARARH